MSSKGESGISKKSFVYDWQLSAKTSKLRYLLFESHNTEIGKF